MITKLNRGQKFLLNGDKLKVTIMFRGREMYNRQDHGHKILKNVIEILKDISIVDKEVELQGKRLSIILSPK